MGQGGRQTRSPLYGNPPRCCGVLPSWGWAGAGAISGGDEQRRAALRFGGLTPLSKPQVASERATERRPEDQALPGIRGGLGTTFSSVGNNGKEGNCSLDGRMRACADLSRRRAIASPAGKPSPSREQRGEGEPRGRCIYSSLLLYHPAGMQALGRQPVPSGAGPGRAQGYWRQPRDVKELRAVAAGGAGPAPPRTAICINSLVVRSRARSPRFAQETRKRSSAAGF